MNHVNEAIAYLRKSTGNDKLQLNGDHVSLDFNGRCILDITKLDDSNIELISILQSTPMGMGDIAYSQLLVANYVGSGTGAARLSLTPEDHELALCQRVDVTKMDESAFESTVIEFVKFASFWNTEDAMKLLSTEPKAHSSNDVDEVIIPA